MDEESVFIRLYSSQVVTGLRGGQTQECVPASIGGLKNTMRVPRGANTKCYANRVSSGVIVSFVKKSQATNGSTCIRMNMRHAVAPSRDNRWDNGGWPIRGHCSSRCDGSRTDAAPATR